MPIRAITFDADDTLWDFTTVARAATVAVAKRLGELRPGTSASADELAATRLAAGKEAEQGTPFPTIRRLAISRFVAANGGADEELTDDLTDLFFAYRDREQVLFPDVVPMLDALPEDLPVGVVTSGNIDGWSTSLADRLDFWLAADQTGLRKPDPRVFEMAAAAAGCRPRELVHVGDEPERDVIGAHAAGARGVWIRRHDRSHPDGDRADAVITSLTELPDLIDRWNQEETQGVGVGPHPRPWPDDPRLNPELLESGDRRNVVDRYRYWSREAIVADLDKRRHPFHVAIENWHHDLNIGTVVRNANAFNAAAVHIVGRRRWNRRGAMVTNRYQHVEHHPTIEEFVTWATRLDLPIIGVDNIPGATPLEETELPEKCVLLFGQESSGLSPEAREACDEVVAITQYGSTRSINAGVASGIAMHTWITRHLR